MKSTLMEPSGAIGSVDNEQLARSDTASRIRGNCIEAVRESRVEGD